MSITQYRMKLKKAERKTMKALHWISQDLELLPDNYKRYEIVDGTLDETDTLQSPFLAGFACKVGQFFTSFMR